MKHKLTIEVFATFPDEDLICSVVTEMARRSRGLNQEFSYKFMGGNATGKWETVGDKKPKASLEQVMECFKSVDTTT